MSFHSYLDAASIVGDVIIAVYLITRCLKSGSVATDNMTEAYQFQALLDLLNEFIESDINCVTVNGQLPRNTPRKVYYAHQREGRLRRRSEDFLCRISNEIDERARSKGERK